MSHPVQIGYKPSRHETAGEGVRIRWEADMATTPITTDKFDSVVTSSAKPVLVDFWASWCGPCRALGPVVEEISGELSDKLDVYKCNVDEEADLATRFRIVSIPTLILFKNGKPVHTMVGNMPKAELKKELEAYL